MVEAFIPGFLVRFALEVLKKIGFLNMEFSCRPYSRPIESPVKVTSLWFEEPIADRQTKTHVNTQGNL